MIMVYLLLLLYLKVLYKEMLLSTVCFALGKEKGLALLNSIKSVSGCFIDDHNQISYSKNFKNIFQIKTPFGVFIQ